MDMIDVERSTSKEQSKVGQEKPTSFKLGEQDQAPGARSSCGARPSNGYLGNAGRSQPAYRASTTRNASSGTDVECHRVSGVLLTQGIQASDLAEELNTDEDWLVGKIKRQAHQSTTINRKADQGVGSTQQNDD